MLYFHANAEDLGMCYYMLDCLKERLGVRVLAMEYPGYGLAEGSSNEDSVDAVSLFLLLLITYGQFE